MVFGAALLFCTGNGIVIRATGAGTLALEISDGLRDTKPDPAFHSALGRRTRPLVPKAVIMLK